MPVTLSDGGVIRRGITVSALRFEDARLLRPDGGAPFVMGPTVEPVKEVLIDGQASNPGVEHSATPLLTFSPSDTGARPDGYEVRLFQVSNQPDLLATAAVNVATFYVQSPSIQVPPGILQPGEVYALKVTARTLPGPWSPSLALAYGYPTAWMDVIVGPIRIMP